MKKYIKCLVCNKEVGYINDEERIVNIYPKGSDVKYVGDNIVASFTHCDKEQKVILK